MVGIKVMFDRLHPHILQGLSSVLLFYRRCRSAVLVEVFLYYTFPVRILCFRGVILLVLLDLP